jgi:hypothetical protein
MLECCARSMIGKPLSGRFWNGCAQPNKRLKLTGRVGVFDFSPARCSLSAIR